MPLPHLVLVPGLMCDEQVWAHQARDLASLATIEVIDHGVLDGLDTMAKAILERAPYRFALAGHSMGGRVAFEVLREAPERVAGVALMDTNYLPRSPEEGGNEEAANRYALLELAKTEGVRSMAAKWVQGMVHPDRLSDAPLIEAIIVMMARKTPEIFEAQIRALLNRRDSTPILSQIRCPALVLCGRQDSWSVLARHEEMAALIPESRLVVVEDCGHMSTMERPEAVTAAMRDWIFLTSW
jgi:pimeloyl-ACP methyl ester carboxylesterase